MTVHVGLLRGINVGGKNKLAMKDLAAIFAAEGATSVKTYIQSGNVVFEAPERLASRLAKNATARIAEQHGLDVPVILRTASELAAVARGNPLLARGARPDSLHVIFLADTPSAKQVATLDPARSPPDRFELCGRDIYVCCPNGVARSKLTIAYFDSKLGTSGTGRNWRTVGKLVELSTR
jgi:uncharacterized protein (DUF1697 family)